MKASPPDQDYLIEMAPDDFALVYDKIKMWKIAPWIIRGGLILMMVIVYFFIFGNGFDLIPAIFVGVFFAFAWGMSEWGMYTFMKRIKTDLEARQKRVVQGELANCYSKNRGKSSSLQGMWVIGEETFRMDSAEYHLARKGSTVRLEMLPTSKVMIKVEVLAS